MLQQAERLDRVFHALADGNRRAILEHLSEGPISVSALAGPLEISVSGVLQHLRILEDSGLVRSEKRGRTRTCVVESAAFGEVDAWIAERRRTWEGHLDRLGSFLTGAMPTGTIDAGAGGDVSASTGGAP
jgi:DNA-binding transcriptional ArsR family regulator